MRYLLAFLTLLAWGLWLGGLVLLLILVVHLFQVNRPAALEAAPIMFEHFARYQLILAAAALLFGALWRLSEGRVLLTWIFVLFALSAIAAIVIAAVITPRMESLRFAGESGSAQFAHLHAWSGLAYSAEAALLLLAGLLLPIAFSARRPTAVACPASGEIKQPS